MSIVNKYQIRFSGGPRSLVRDLRLLTVKLIRDGDFWNSDSQVWSLYVIDNIRKSVMLKIELSPQQYFITLGLSRHLFR